MRMIQCQYCKRYFDNTARIYMACDHITCSKICQTNIFNMVSKFDNKLKTPLEWKDLNKIRKINSINSKLEEICKQKDTTLTNGQNQEDSILTNTHKAVEYSKINHNSTNENSRNQNNMNNINQNNMNNINENNMNNINENYMNDMNDIWDYDNRITMYSKILYENIRYVSNNYLYNNINNNNILL